MIEPQIRWVNSKSFSLKLLKFVDESQTFMLLGIGRSQHIAYDLAEHDCA